MPNIKASERELHSFIKHTADQHAALSVDCAGPPPEKLLPATTVDREKTCPLLLRVFPKRGGHHKCVHGQAVFVTAVVCCGCSHHSIRPVQCSQHQV